MDNTANPTTSLPRGRRCFRCVGIGVPAMRGADGKVWGVVVPGHTDHLALKVCEGHEDGER